MTATVPLLFASLVMLGFLAQWVAWRLKLPAILLLLLLGLTLGPGTGIYDPDALLGDLLFPSVSMAVAIILFEGSLTLKLDQIRGHGQVVTRLVTLGVVATVLIIGYATHELFGLSLGVSFLFGAIVSVSGPTVIVPLLRTVRPRRSIANILRWEGILIDPIGALLAVILFQFVAATGPDAGGILIIPQVFGIGIALGLAGAFGFAFLLRRHLLPDYLKNIAALATVLLTFAISNALAHESGLLAVTVMGVVMANMKHINTEGILDFKESLTLILISLLFITLAARVSAAEISDLGEPLIWLLAIVLFVARPIAVLLSTIGSPIGWRESVLLSWMAPRGIVAAAVSAVFAIRLQGEGFERAGDLVPLTFAVILVTVVAQGFTARPLARLLGLSEPDDKGVLVVGGTPIALAIAKSLHKAGVDVILADTSWNAMKDARMAGLRTFPGNVVSQKADRSLDLIGIGQLLALSDRAAYNSLACLRYRSEFGSENIFSLRMPSTTGDGDPAEPASPLRGRLLFREEVTLEKLNRRLREGATVKLTGLTDKFKFDDLMKQQNNEGEPLYAISPGGMVYPFSENRSFKAGAGWKIATLIYEPEDTPAADKESSAAQRARSHLVDSAPKPLPS